MDDATLVYDDDCGFCTWWALALEKRADIRLVGFSDLTEEMRERLPEDYEECAHLLVDGDVYSCGESIEKAFVRTEIGDGARPALDFLRQFDEYDSFREKAYRVVADNRDLFGKIISVDPPARSDSATDD